MGNLALSENREEVRLQLMEAKEMIAPVLPAHVNFEQTVARMYKHLFENPKLAECTPASLFWSFVQSAEVGLSVGGFFGEGFIVPYGSSRNPNAPKRAVFIPGYKGLIKLAYQSSLIHRIDGFVIFEKDRFVANLGTNQVDYEPYIGAADPGKVIAAYTQIQLSNGALKHSVMPMWALERIRQSAPGRNKSDHPWNTHTAEMYRKTGLRHALKDAPKNSEVDRAIDRALQLDEVADSEMAYDSAAPSLPGLSEEASEAAPTRTSETRARVQHKTPSRRRQPQAAPKAQPQAAPAQPQAAPAQPQPAPKAQPQAPKPAPTPQAPPPSAQPSEPQAAAPAKAPAAPQAAPVPPSEQDASPSQADAPAEAGEADDDFFG